MLETPHVIVGATIASKIGNPLLALPLSFASHFVLDKIPHWNPHINTELVKNGEISKKSKSVIALDVSVALVSGLAISYFKLPDLNAVMFVLLGAFFAVLPDVVEGPYYFWNFRTKLIERWVRFQKSIQTDTDLVPGVLTQVLIVITSLFWFFN